MVGELLGHYRIVKEIGSGGAGVVYEAWDERLERQVAVKVLFGRAASGGPEQERLRREALALSRSNHPNIATVHDFDFQDGVAFLVMELISGTSLAALVAAGPLSEHDVIDFGSQLAAGLAVAHAGGVIHRDLKPGNVRITPEGRLKILDFGLARVLARQNQVTVTDTHGSFFAGTLPYMSPEQFKGHPPDVRSDIYAAGAVLYEMATGRRPFSGESEAALMHAILNQPLVVPSVHAPLMSRGLEAVILRALDRDPGLRYQSASELQVDLQRLTNAVGVPLTPPPVPRRRRVSTIVAAAAVGLAILAIWSVSRRSEDEAPGVSSGPAPSAGTAAQTEPMRVAIMPPEHLPDTQTSAGWPELIETLLASNLAGTREISIIDPQSVRATFENRRAGADRLQALAAANVGLAVRIRILPADGTRELECSVIETANQVVAFSTRAPVESEAALRTALGELSEALTEYFRLRLIGAELDQDLRPWISLRAYKVQAVRAFVQAAQYVFRYQPGEPRRYYQRALEIDPTFVAPRVWRLPGLLDEGRRDLVDSDLAYLRSIEPLASPFEQAMIAYSGALVDNDTAAQARHLEVALRYAPGNRILLINLGYVQELQNDCRATLQTILPLIETKWAYAPLYSQWARCAIRLGRLDEARTVLEGSLDTAPPWPDVYAFLEGLAVIRGDEQQAARYADLHRTRLREVLNASRSEESASAYASLGEIAATNGQTARAAALFEKAVEFSPDTPGYRDKLAAALQAAGRIRESTEQKDRAAALRRGRGR